MKRFSAMLALALSIAVGLAAQDADSIILAYRRNFARASLVTKLELLKEAALKNDATMGPLFDMALRFAVDNSALLGPDPLLKDLAVLSAAEASRASYTKAIDNLWAVFQVFKDTDVRAASITAMGSLGAGESRVAENLNAFLASQNSLFRSGAQPEYPALEACIDALGRLGDGSSFPVLFSAYVAAYTPTLASKAALALGSIKGDYRGYLLQVITKNPPLEKAAAFAAGMENPKFTDADRGELSEAAMASALAYASDGSGLSAVEQQALRDIRFQSARRIRALKWQKASPYIIKHFRLIQVDYAKGFASKADLLDAVACLGVMGSTEASLALALNLQLLNAQTAQGAPYDESFILAVIAALGELGDMSAFDYLLEIGYFQYNDTIKKAARDALKKLKM